jgi:calcium-dependent protein kinase
MGTIFNIVGCECNKESNNNNNKLKIYNSVKPVRVSDYSSTEMICSMIIPREIYIDQPKKSFSSTDLVKKNYDNKKKIFEKYTKICILGKNNYNMVYKVNNKLSNKLQAMKKILKAKVENFDDTKNIIKFINILSNLKQKNLAKLYEFYEDEKYFYIINELCEDTLLDKILDENNTLCEFIVKFIMYRIFLALKYLHKNQIIHGDIKITNIGFTYKEKYKVKNEIKVPIIDLISEASNDEDLQKELLNSNDYDGLSIKAKNYIKNLSKYDIKLLDCMSQEIFIKNIIDYENSDILLNINYYSPELFNGIIMKQRDEWACGILMFKLLKGIYPFEGDNKDELVNDIINEDINKEINKLKVSNNCKDLIKRLLDKKPENRIKVEESLKLDYFKTGVKFKIQKT